MADRKFESGDETIPSSDGPRRKLPRRNEPPRNTVPLRDALSAIVSRPHVLDREVVDPTAIEIGLELRRARQQAGLTQSQVAELAGMTQSALSDIENGKGTDGPNYRTIRDIAAAIGGRITLAPARNGLTVAAFEGTESVSLAEQSRDAAVATTIVPEDAMKLMRAVVSRDEFVKVRKVLKKAGTHFAEPQPLGCRLWSIHPRAKARLNVLRPTVFVMLRDVRPVAAGRPFGQPVGTIVSVVLNDQTLEVDNAADEPVSFLSLGADGFLAAVREERQGAVDQ